MTKLSGMIFMFLSSNLKWNETLDETLENDLHSSRFELELEHGLELRTKKCSIRTEPSKLNFYKQT
jgi:uncharacterized protein YggU (UPF0235/DUF167 family)